MKSRGITCAFLYLAALIFIFSLAPNTRLQNTQAAGGANPQLTQYIANPPSFARAWRKGK
jgi:hypothetical protein